MNEPKIEFEQVERDCQHNKDLKAKKKAFWFGDKIIYDYRVLIDGEHRATCSWRQGVRYNLYDCTDEPIKRHARSTIPLEVKGRVHFEEKIRQLLSEKLIPTVAQAKQRAEEERKKMEAFLLEHRKEVEAQERRERLADAAPALIAAAKNAIGYIERNGFGHDQEERIKELTEAISKAEKA